MISPQRFISELLDITPNGLTVRTLCDVLMQQDVSEEDASLAIRGALDRGLIKLGVNLNIVSGAA